MSTIQEIYHSFIQPLTSTDRLNLATLILNELVQQNASPINQRDDWTEEDEADILQFSLQHATSLFPDEEDI